MAFYRLADGVSFGEVGGLPVFLDLHRDRYFRLDAGGMETFSELVRDEGSASRRSDRLDKLVDAGLLARSAEPGAITPAPSFVPEASVLDRSPRRQQFKPVDVAEIWMGLARVRRQLGHGQLPRLVSDHLKRKRDRGSTSKSRGAETLASDFLAARRIIPVEPNCLSDSLTLARYLARRSEFPSIVFGVKIDPFGAHCWLQTGSEILNDAGDRVREFTPVLVV